MRTSFKAGPLRDAIWKTLRTSVDNPFAIVSGFSVFFGVVQALTLGTGVVRVPFTQSFAWAVLVIAAAVGALAVRIGHAAGQVRPQRDTTETQCVRILAALFLGSSIALYFFLCIQAYLKPDMSWDGPAYHIPPIHFWSLDGRVHAISTGLALGTEGIDMWLNGITNIMNAFPMGTEAFSFVIVQATRNTNMVNTVNLFYVPMAVFSLIYLARALDCGTALSCMSGAAFVLLPVTIQQSATTKVDCAFAACVLAVFAGCVHFLRRIASRQLAVSDAFPLGAAMGLMLGAKPSGIVLYVLTWAALFLLSIALVIRLVRPQAGGASAEGNTHQEQHPSFKLFLRCAGVLALVLMTSYCVGGYWHTRNFVLTGNPVWPLKVTFNGKELFPSAKVVDSEESDRAFSPQKLWLQGGIGEKITEWPKSIRDHSNWYGGIGYLWLFGCLPAIGIALAASAVSLVRYWRSKGVRSWFGAHLWPLLAICVAGFIILPGAGRARYSYWVYGLGLPCFFWLTAWIVRMRPRIVRPWTYLPRVWVVLCLGIALFEGFYCAAWWGTKSYAWATGHNWPAFADAPIRSLRTLWWHDPVGYIMPPLSCTVFDEILRGNDAVALHRMHNPPLSRLLIGQLSSPIGARTIYFIGHEVLSDEAALTEQIERHHIRFIIVEYDYKVPEAALKLAARVHEIPFHFWVLEYLQ